MAVVDVESIRVLSLRPDDVIVARIATRLGAEKAAEIKRVLQDALPGRKVLVHDDSIELTVARSEGES